MTLYQTHALEYGAVALLCAIALVKHTVIPWWKNRRG